MRLASSVYRLVEGALIALVASSIAGAQTVRGIVVDAGDRPVPGVVVQLLDSVSRVAGRALTDERGEFRLAVQAGSYRLHTLRIGFRPTDSPPLTLQSGSDLTKRIVLTGLPIALDTVRVAGRNACRALHDSGSAYAVWEQIHAAISAAALTAAMHNVFTTTIAYERTLEADGRTVRAQTSTVQSGYVRAPWGTRSPEVLHLEGYVSTSRDNITTYFAPGLEVLLSPSFVADHCFHITVGSNRLGLAFEPAPDRRKMPEVHGTLWLDARTAELKSMEFRYVNVLPEQEAVAFGEAEFVHMANGMWTISRWSIRMPVLEQVVLSAGRGGSQLQVAAIHVAGGQLALARTGTDTLWTRPLLSLTGTVEDSSSGRMIPGARLRVAGTNMVDSTDSHGHFGIPGLLLGQYTLEVRTPSLDSISAFHQIGVAFTDSAAPIRLRIPNAAQLMSLVCGDKMREAPGVVFGSVSSAFDSTSSRNVRVTAAWTQTFMPVGGQSVAEVGSRRQSLDTRTDAHGNFRLCGVPVDKPITLTVGDGSVSSALVRIPANGRFAHASLALEHASPGNLSVFVGIVRDSAGRPVVAANISLPVLAKNTVTDADGAFRIEGVPAGMQRVLVRRLGFRAIDTSLAFSPDRTIQRQFELARAVTLDSVIVTESAVDKRLESFDNNRRLGLGHFLTYEELIKMENVSTGSVLSALPGAEVHSSGPHAWIRSSRSPVRLGASTLLDQTDMAKGAPAEACYANVYVDHQAVFRNLKMGSPPRMEPLFDVNSIPVSEIEGIEFYASPAETPLEYSGLESPCGVLVIHTRRYHPKDTTNVVRRPR